jgi:transcriptional regulator with XRE-family HTH domain
MSQEAATLRCGIDRAYLGRLERDAKNPTIATIWQIADAWKRGHRSYWLGQRPSRNTKTRIVRYWA